MMNSNACFPYLIKSAPDRSLLISFLLVALLCFPQIATSQSSVVVRRDTVPNPSTVWPKSAILPGWGQVVNKQAWKIPIIYGAFAGIAWYGANQHQSYIDYRAAYYNSVPGRTDQIYGGTRPDLEGLPPELLRFNRNSYRNRRDLSIIVFVAAWGLNVVDAYVFAHLRDYDVGPDLSIHPKLDYSPFGDKQIVAVDLKLTIPLKTSK